MSVFSERLKELRKEKYRSMDDFAREIRINLNTYKTYETGRSEPKYESLVNMAQKLNVSIDYLLGVQDIRNSWRMESELKEENEALLLYRFRSLNKSGQEALMNISAWMAKAIRNDFKDLDNV